MMSHEPQPGEFREATSADAKHSGEAEPFVYEPHCNQTLAESYRALGARMEEQPTNILYPCCDVDVTPSAAFPHANVRYVDMNRQAMEALIAQGYEAHVARVPTGREEGTSSSDFSGAPLFTPKDPVDLLILLNPQISPLAIANCVRHRGYVLCNNYHQTADEMHTHSDFAPVAMLHTGKASELDTSSLDDYFTLISSDEEYVQADPEAYNIIQRFIYGRIRTMFPRLFDVTNAVPQFLARARGQCEVFDTVYIGNHSLPKPLRKKSSAVNDLFLFQRLT